MLHQYRCVCIINCSYHHHIPNDAVGHANEVPVQRCAQSKAVVGVAQHADVGDASSQILAHQQVVEVGLDAGAVGVMPRSGGVLGAHSGKRVARGGLRVVNAVEVDVQDVQVRVDLGLVDGVGAGEHQVDVIQRGLGDARVGTGGEG